MFDVLSHQPVAQENENIFRKKCLSIDNWKGVSLGQDEVSAMIYLAKTKPLQIQTWLFTLELKPSV